ncbi:hypothetical protein FHG87_005928 [Trinorchestia longiramus]|nr:hypothetical protein FHG87_005928 [Trinorchestia longiramus]
MVGLEQRTKMAFLLYTNVSKFWAGLPYLILAGIGTLGMAVSSFLPETLGQDLPQNLDDAEYFLIEEPYFSFKGRMPCKTRKTILRKHNGAHESPLRQRAADRAAADVSTTEALNSSKKKLGDGDDNLFSSTQVILGNEDEFSEIPDDRV